MATYTGSWLPKLYFKKTDASVATLTTSSNSVEFRSPDGDTPIAWANGSGAGQFNKAGYGSLSLAAAAATIDLTTVASVVTNWVGDSVFAAVKQIKIINTATAGTNKPVTVGAAASTPFTGPLGGTSPTEAIAAGHELNWSTGEAAGWACGTNKNLKLDPGANTVTVVIAIMGI